MPRRVLIMGAAGRDFHNFNVVFRDDPETEVVAFTATQIPYIDDRTYPAALAGPRYPEGIRIHEEDELPRLIRQMEVDDVVFAYSDVSHEYVMHKASEALAAGANFLLLGPNATMLKPDIPTVAVTAVRTGVGKSQTTRAVAATLKEAGKKVVAVRHPDAVRRPHRPACPTIRRARGPRPASLHDRGARGVRAAHHDRNRDLRGRGLRRDPGTGSGRGRRPPVGRGKQRPPVLSPGRPHRARRPPAGRPRDEVSPR